MRGVAGAWMGPNWAGLGGEDGRGWAKMGHQCHRWLASHRQPTSPEMSRRRTGDQVLGWAGEGRVLCDLVVVVWRDLRGLRNRRPWKVRRGMTNQATYEEGSATRGPRYCRAVLCCAVPWETSQEEKTPSSRGCAGD